MAALLDGATDINYADRRGDTALHWAPEHKQEHVTTVDFLHVLQFSCFLLPVHA